MASCLLKLREKSMGFTVNDIGGTFNFRCPVLVRMPTIPPFNGHITTVNSLTSSKFPRGMIDHDFEMKMQIFPKNIIMIFACKLSTEF